MLELETTALGQPETIKISLCKKRNVEQSYHIIDVIIYPTYYGNFVWHIYNYNQIQNLKNWNKLFPLIRTQFEVDTK